MVQDVDPKTCQAVVGSIYEPLRKKALKDLLALSSKIFDLAHACRCFVVRRNKDYLEVVPGTKLYITPTEEQLDVL